MNAVEFSALVASAIGILLAVLTLPRSMQRWVLPTTVAVIIVVIAIPLPGDRRLWFVVAAIVLLSGSISGWLAVNWLRNRKPRQTMLLLVESMSNGHIVTDADLPLTLVGRFAGHARGVRVVCQDGADRWYLQHPEVALDAGGRWTAANIRPGRDIKRLLFVQLGRRAKAYFDEMARNNTWTAFADLPANSRPLAKVEIDRQ